MAIAPPLHSDEQDEQMQIMALRNLQLQMVEKDDEEDDDAGLEKDLKRLLARAEALQQEQDEDDDVLAAESWEWAVGVEAVARHAVETMVQDEADIHGALSSSSSSSQRPPGEEEAAELRADAARVVELRGYAEDVVATVRRLMEADLRKLVADAETHIPTLTHEQLATAAKFEFIALGMENWMASLAARLNRGVADFADRPGEEAFVAAMRMEATKADEAKSAIARYRAAAAGSSSLAPAADQMEQD